MNFRLFLALSFAILTPQVFGQGDNDVKRGSYPPMAFIYYLDDTITDASGARFLQSAFLIRLDWLVTSAIDVNNHNFNVVGFPTKTLLARVGSVTVDPKFTLNEDEDEQEQEIIQVVRPYNHNSSAWWRTDISLLKTLLPFNLTNTVRIAYFNLQRKSLNKSCFVLSYIKEYGNFSDDKVLKRTAVELQIPSNKETCGAQFVENTMICAVENEENKNNSLQEFCIGNSGGPLMCDNEIIGIQTYAEPNCKPPYLYQLLSGWETFISCGTDEKCQDDACANQCVSYSKDPETRRRETELKTGGYDKIVTIYKNNKTTAVPETVPEEGEIKMTPTLTAVPASKTRPAKQDVTTKTAKPSKITSTVKEVIESVVENRRKNRKLMEQYEEDGRKSGNVGPKAAEEGLKSSAERKGGAERNTGVHLLFISFIFWYLFAI